MFLSYKFVKSRFPPPPKIGEIFPPPLTSPSGGGNLVPPTKFSKGKTLSLGSIIAIFASSINRLAETTLVGWGKGTCGGRKSMFVEGSKLVGRKWTILVSWGDSPHPPKFPAYYRKFSGPPLNVEPKIFRSSLKLIWDWHHDIYCASIAKKFPICFLKTDKTS